MEGLSGISKKLIDPLKLVGMINYSLITSSATTGKKFINPAETNSNSYIAFTRQKYTLLLCPDSAIRVIHQIFPTVFTSLGTSLHLSPRFIKFSGYNFQSHLHESAGQLH